ncbi:cytochrome c oxidase subunit 2 [Tranquillimonas rosea]|uniref:Cytochrome c oxidase subunit 2 n=1 Tax=Tranquillimonas rosea TaxID=641238 RepID=A0A1H9UX20_9RHOB|nr:cytochrome c oxidase subunit II [Tranquillimonas rosea]SES13878.1 cytochrome c oxidase subunit 2 [Tranquillimonas rosea]
MRLIRQIASLGATAFALAAGPVAAQSNDGIGELQIEGAPQPGGIGFQEAATSIARDLQWLDGMILAIITAIVLFVTGLLIAVMVLHNRGRNKTPSRFTHNTPIEVTWTVVPVVILMFIGAFSLPVLFNQQEIPEADVTVKATGYQWYWGYEYPDEGIAFDSFMIGYGENYVTDDIRAQLQEAGYTEDEFRLATDEAMVVPVGQTIVVQVTGGDVIHSWTVPAFGVKQDAVPGRLAELWFEAEKEGVYFGQCSELCGKDHSYMPITVKVVSQQEYQDWVDSRTEETASAAQAAGAVQVASAE